MKGLFVWVIGPILFAGVGFSLYVLGGTLNAIQVVARLNDDLQAKGLRGSTLKDLSPIFESQLNSANYRSAERLLELGELVERQDYTTLLDRLANQRTVAQLRIDEHVIEQLKAASASEDYQVLKSIIIQQIVDLIGPKPRVVEKKLYQIAADYLPLPKLENP